MSSPCTSPVAFLGISLLGITFLHAQSAGDLPPVQNQAALLQELDQLSSGNSSYEQNRRSTAISQIQSAVSSPSSSTELYLNAIDATKYNGKHQDFLDWKQKNQDMIRNASYQNAAQLQLRYLLLGLQRSKQNDAFAQVPEVMAYLNSLQELHFLEDPYKAPPNPKGLLSPPPLNKISQDASSLIKQPLPDSPVVQWLRIADLLPDKNFEKSAGDYFSILENNVKNPLRERKDLQLTAVWDLQIATASTVSSSQDQETGETFRVQLLPQLIFGKLHDTATLGQTNRALSEMMQLIRTYPSHPDAPKWIDAAKSLIKGTPLPPLTPSVQEMPPAQADAPAP